jgi:hypothetical protein
MKILNLEINSIDNLVNQSGLPLWKEFFSPVYKNLYELINPNSSQYPHIDFDNFKIVMSNILNLLTEDDIKTLRSLGNGIISKAEWEKSPENKAMMVFCWNFPEFANLLCNIHLLSLVSIKAAEVCLNIKIDAQNFINAKQFIDRINRQKWTRPQTNNEQQSGVSNLGGVSESLLEMAMEKLIDGTNFFKTHNQKIQSYGDFVLMCLPNNLWLSVKSNFARERLLASGYTTDILGVGFFTSKDEFTSQSKIRNFQRVGFLAMYLPDIPVSEDQVENNTNTYTEVQDFYDQNNISLPLNINGTLFLRPLSQLHQDISKILAISDISNRTTLGF